MKLRRAISGRTRAELETPQTQVSGAQPHPHVTLSAMSSHRSAQSFLPVPKVAHAEEGSSPAQHPREPLFQRGGSWPRCRGIFGQSGTETENFWMEPVPSRGSQEEEGGNALLSACSEAKGRHSQQHKLGDPLCYRNGFLQRRCSTNWAGSHGARRTAEPGSPLAPSSSVPLLRNLWPLLLSSLTKWGFK